MDKPIFRNLATGFSLFLTLLTLGREVSAGSLVLTWRPNSEVDLSGYRIYYGTKSGEHPYFIDVGNTTRFEVTNLEGGVRYYFVLTAYDFWGNESGPSNEVSGVVGAKDFLPDVLVLFQNYPNPFNSHTIIEFNLPQMGEVEVAIYNDVGQLVRRLFEGEGSAGINSLPWDGRDDAGNLVASGGYFCQVKYGSATRTKPMQFVK